MKKKKKVINPKIIVLFGNQVVLSSKMKKISVSKSRKELHHKKIALKEYDSYAVN